MESAASPPLLLLIARHGNTFEPHETPRRVGGRTDIPLTADGLAQGCALGALLKAGGYRPDRVYSSDLLRTRQTAQQAIESAGYSALPIVPLSLFNEVDYGPDENKTEKEVIARIGEQALKDWDTKAIVPKGWNFTPQTAIDGWRDFAAGLVKGHIPCTLVVTSNGIARFAPYLTGDPEGFIRNHKLKISTGALCVLAYQSGSWQVMEWNIKPPIFTE